MIQGHDCRHGSACVCCLVDDFWMTFCHSVKYCTFIVHFTVVMHFILIVHLIFKEYYCQLNFPMGTSKLYCTLLSCLSIIMRNDFQAVFSAHSWEALLTEPSWKWIWTRTTTYHLKSLWRWLMSLQLAVKSEDVVCTHMHTHMDTCTCTHATVGETGAVWDRISFLLTLKLEQWCSV